MSTKGYKQTEEHKRKIGAANAIALKGRVVPEEVRKKIRISCNTDKHREKQRLVNLGRKLKESTKIKMGMSHLGQIVSPLTREMIGNANRAEKNGMFGKRFGKKLGSLKRHCLERDNYTCQRCGLNDKDILVVDHITPKSLRPDLREDLSNLVTLCANCHLRKSKSEMKNKVYGRWMVNKE